MHTQKELLDIGTQYTKIQWDLNIAREVAELLTKTKNNEIEQANLALLRLEVKRKSREARNTISETQRQTLDQIKVLTQTKSDLQVLQQQTLDAQNKEPENIATAPDQTRDQKFKSSLSESTNYIAQTRDGLWWRSKVAVWAWALYAGYRALSWLWWTIFGDEKSEVSKDSSKVDSQSSWVSKRTIGVLSALGLWWAAYYFFGDKIRSAVEQKKAEVAIEAWIWVLELLPLVGSIGATYLRDIYNQHKDELIDIDDEWNAKIKFMDFVKDHLIQDTKNNVPWAALIGWIYDQCRNLFLWKITSDPDLKDVPKTQAPTPIEKVVMTMWDTYRIDESSRPYLLWADGKRQYIRIAKSQASETFGDDIWSITSIKLRLFDDYLDMRTYEASHVAWDSSPETQEKIEKFTQALRNARYIILPQAVKNNMATLAYQSLSPWKKQLSNNGILATFMQKSFEDINRCEDIEVIFGAKNKDIQLLISTLSDKKDYAKNRLAMYDISRKDLWDAAKDIVWQWWWNSQIVSEKLQNILISQPKYEKMRKLLDVSSTMMQSIRSDINWSNILSIAKELESVWLTTAQSHDLAQEVTQEYKTIRKKNESNRDQFAQYLTVWFNNFATEQDKTRFVQRVKLQYHYSWDDFDGAFQCWVSGQMNNASDASTSMYMQQEIFYHTLRNWTSTPEEVMLWSILGIWSRGVFADKNYDTVIEGGINVAICLIPIWAWAMAAKFAVQWVRAWLAATRIAQVANSSRYIQYASRFGIASAEAIAWWSAMYGAWLVTHNLLDKRSEWLFEWWSNKELVKNIAFCGILDKLWPLLQTMNITRLLPTQIIVPSLLKQAWNIVIQWTALSWINNWVDIMRWDDANRSASEFLQWLLLIWAFNLAGKAYQKLRLSRQNWVVTLSTINTVNTPQNTQLLNNIIALGEGQTITHGTVVITKTNWFLSYKSNWWAEVILPAWTAPTVMHDIALRLSPIAVAPVPPSAPVIAGNQRNISTLSAQFATRTPAEIYWFNTYIRNNPSKWLIMERWQRYLIQIENGTIVFKSTKAGVPHIESWPQHTVILQRRNTVAYKQSVDSVFGRAKNQQALGDITLRQALEAQGYKQSSWTSKLVWHKIQHFADMKMSGLLEKYWFNFQNSSCITTGDYASQIFKWASNLLLNPITMAGVWYFSWDNSIEKRWSVATNTTMLLKWTSKPMIVLVNAIMLAIDHRDDKLWKNVNT